jgi:hypothetical protein
MSHITATTPLSRNLTLWQVQSRSRQLNVDKNVN